MSVKIVGIETCDNCRNSLICEITSGLWGFYRETLQGKVEKSHDCMKKMIDIMASHCQHWQEYTEDYQED